MSFKLVEVKWLDHRDKPDSDWTRLKKVIKDLEKPVEVHTVGYLVKETDQYVILATTVDFLSKHLDTAYAALILKGVITAMKVYE